MAEVKMILIATSLDAVTLPPLGTKWFTIWKCEGVESMAWQADFVVCVGNIAEDDHRRWAQAREKVFAPSKSSSFGRLQWAVLYAANYLEDGGQ